MKKNIIRKYFVQADKLKINNRRYFQQVKFLLNFFLQEDLAGKGDVTSNLLFKANKTAGAKIVVKQNGILAGLEEIKWFLRQHKVKFQVKAKDGQPVKRGEIILVLRGNLRKILSLERTILNILQRMSGIATQTKKLVKKVGTTVLLCPTRKTQWGLLDKRAVVVGGGGTHRLGLYDFVLIKDNHLKILNSHLLTEGKKFQILNFRNFFWEIEVESARQAVKMAKLNPGAMMFDNFKPADIRQAIRKVSVIDKNIIFEASGGINETNIISYAKSGVDLISLGSLTHSVKALDMSLEAM